MEKLSISSGRITLANVNVLARKIFSSNIEPGEELKSKDLTEFSQFAAADTLAFRLNQVRSTSTTDNSTHRYLFATGNLDNRLKPGFQKQFSIDRFFSQPV